MPLVLRPFQTRLFEKIDRQLARTGMVRQVWLKSRQIGGSTLAQGLMFWRAAMNPYVNAIVVAHDVGIAQALFFMSRRFYDNLDPSLQPMVRYSTRTELTFDNPSDRDRGMSRGLNSKIIVATARNVHSGAGGTFNFCHLCLDPSTRVWSGDRLICVRDLAPGDAIVTGTGEVAKVNAVVTQPSDHRPWVRIRVNGATHDPITCTADHPLLTSEGWKPAGDLTRKDRLILPVRTLSASPIPSLDLAHHYAPRYSAIKNRTYERWAPANPVFPLTYDTGWMLGLFVAEGSVKWGGGQISLHVDERLQAERFRNLIAPWAAKVRITDRSVNGGPKTRVVSFDSAGLSEFLKEHFYGPGGHRAHHKRLPAWFWDAPHDFVQGLLHGYVFGDAGKTALSMVPITTTSPYLAAQVRDLLVTLGYGWPLLRFRGGGFRNNRNEQDRHTIIVMGAGSRRLLREVWGQELPGPAQPRPWPAGRGRTLGQKWRMHYPNHIAIRITGAEPIGPPPEMTDVEVDHPHHSFRLVGAVVKNSEASRYPNAEEIQSSTLESVPEGRGSFVIVESTAWPTGHWFKAMCDLAQSGESAYEFEFVPYTDDPTLWTPLEPGETLDPTGEEVDLMTQHGLVPEQLKWRRRKLAEYRGNTDEFSQAYPLTPQEAWITKEWLVFPPAHLRALRAGVCAPRFRAHVLPRGHVAKAVDGELAVWAEPEAGALYDVGADVAGGSESGNYSTCHVTRRPTNEQVAEYRAHIDPGQFADVIASIGWYYHTAQVNPEANNMGVYTVGELFNRVGYPNIYFQRKIDRVDQPMSKWGGFQTTLRSKETLIAHAKDRIYRWATGPQRDHYPLIRSEALWKELSVYVQEPGKPQYHAAPGKDDHGEDNHDDLVMAFLLALFTTYDEPTPPDLEPAAMATAGPPADRWARDPTRMMQAHEGIGRAGRPTAWLGDLEPWEPA